MAKAFAAVSEDTTVYISELQTIDRDLKLADDGERVPPLSWTERTRMEQRREVLKGLIREAESRQFHTPAVQQARPIVAERARNGCECRKVAVTTDAAGNIYELHHRASSPASAQTNALLNKAQTLLKQARNLSARADANAERMTSVGLAVQRKAEPAYLPPTPYHE